MGRIQPQQGSTGARIRALDTSSQSTQNMRPKFCLEHLRKNYCISNCEHIEKASFADRLHQMSQLTWQQLAESGRHGQGFETISRDAIKGDALPVAVTDDVTLLAFRFHGKAPMVGFRKAEVFHILWLDRAFKLYDH